VQARRIDKGSKIWSRASLWEKSAHPVDRGHAVGPQLLGLVPTARRVRSSIGDRDGIYDPGTPDGRLLLDLKGTISELEWQTIRGRLTAGLLAKAERHSTSHRFRPRFFRCCHAGPKS
jgi:hypothetical protein